MIKIAPSLLAADFGCLRDEIRKAEKGGADLLHLDVMDGNFVPNITFGPLIVEAVRRLTDLKLDVHLMIQRPDRHLDAFAASGADCITLHVEACDDIAGALRHISATGVCAGVALNPETPPDRLRRYLGLLDVVLVMSVNPGFGGQTFLPSSVEKIKNLRRWIDEDRLKAKIEVDGGIYHKTAPLVTKAGAHILVAGSAIFGPGNVEDNIKTLRDYALRGISR
ncbi:MAG TPA: ribulose-phosphate 3-epimerase [Candidatus Latescibacteria bacterium]|nr:ribulose-phosphate 3-epimerase [Candidatus Latescibacterota bacterium]